MKIRALENSTNIQIENNIALKLAEKKAEKKERAGNLNTLLKKARKSRGWSTRSMAAELGVSQQYLSMMEAGTKPLNARAIKLVHKEII